MIIYNPTNTFIKERIEEAEEILKQIPTKYCFITGSFLYKEKYKDIDVFVISRSKKKITVTNSKVKMTIIDFSDVYSLFYPYTSNSCVAQNILPMRPLKVTLADYWHVINEAVPTILNEKNKLQKEIRFLVLYSEYFKSKEVLDTEKLTEKISQFQDYKAVLKYINKEVPEIIGQNNKESYIKRFFYTQAGFYKDLLDYKAQHFLYSLVHSITRGMSNSRC